MKISLTLLFSLMLATVQAQDLSYYFGTAENFDRAIPTPASVIGHEVGEWHVTHDRLVMYMKALAAAAPQRVKYQKLGNTYEGREQLALIITSPENQQRLEAIRNDHVKLSTGQGGVSTADMPIVVYMGYSIHGNESSGSNAALLTAYYLAAGRSEQLEKMLRNTVILLDPSFNPDGLNRFASWANTNKSTGTAVTDPASRELNEMWPGGRFNHYWFDLNRDWLPAQHLESRNRLAFYHSWKPNFLTDHHEQGSNSTFFFQPGVPSRTNPNTPARNQELTAQMAEFHARALDSIGSAYFTKEGFDDYYYGKGSTYPDINGAVGILFEQASSRGHAQETENGLLTFPFTIRNQLVTSISTLKAAYSMRKAMLDYQQQFFVDATREAGAFPTKAFLFGQRNDRQKTEAFVELLLRHQIQVRPLASRMSQGGRNYEPGYAFVVPASQPQFRLIKTIFERNLAYKDSLFYDVTSWTLPLAFGLGYAELSTVPQTGNPLMSAIGVAGQLINVPGAAAYVFRWNELKAPAMAYALQKAGLSLKVATQPFEARTVQGSQRFGFGSIVLSPQAQTKNRQEMESILAHAAQAWGVDVYGAYSSLSTTGIDLGSNSLAALKQPKVMMVVGNGVNPPDAGEIWHLLDTRFHIPVTMVEMDRLAQVSLARYTTILLPGGSYGNFTRAIADKLSAWVATGGTLVAIEDAAKVVAANGLTNVRFRSTTDKADSTLNLPFYLRSDEQRAKDMAGSLFEARMDTTHPLCYGYSDSTVSIFKSNILFMDENNGAYDSPVMFTKNPLQSGYLYRGFRSKISSAAVANIDALGRGRIISLSDNLNFRAFWLGTSRLFMNAVFFGELMRM